MLHALATTLALYNPGDRAVHVRMAAHGAATKRVAGIAILLQQHSSLHVEAGALLTATLGRVKGAIVVMVNGARLCQGIHGYVA